MNTIVIQLEGNIPSKKNSRINTRSGRSFPNKDFMQWQKDAIIQLKNQTRERLTVPIKLEVDITLGKNLRCDLDNKLSSVLDMLVEAKFIQDDKFQNVPDITVRGKYVKGRYFATLKIMPLFDI